MNTNTENDKHRVDGMKIGEYVQGYQKIFLIKIRFMNQNLIKLQKQDFCKIKLI